jgi:RND family efflux transporter MFP subunit
MVRLGRRHRLLGIVIGLLLLTAGVLGVLFWNKPAESRTAPRPIRPLKTLVVGKPIIEPGRKYPGRVRANEEVNLAFNVAGQLIEFPLKKGQRVTKGELLARLDPRDFENTLADRKAVLEKAKFDLDKIRSLYEKKVAAKDELTRAQSDFDTASAQVKIAEKALEDTYLKAPFAGLIANTFVKNYQNVQAKQTILSLQDISEVTIEVNIPEERIARTKESAEELKLAASFDYLPGREFNVRIKEYATEADPKTQTYEVTFVMPEPKDVKIFPGMTATITEYATTLPSASEAGIAIPLSLVPIDGVGQYYVWVVQEDKNGTARVHRQNVKVGKMTNESILVLGGIKPGQRIAAAGVHLLEEGQPVQILRTKESSMP